MRISNDSLCRLSSPNVLVGDPFILMDSRLRGNDNSLTGRIKNEKVFDGFIVDGGSHGF